MVLELLTPFEWFILVFFLCIFMFTGIGFAWYMMRKLRWSIKVTVLQKLPNTYAYGITATDRARLVGIADGGEKVYRLKKLKVYRPGYGRFIGHNHIAWAVDESGLWYNVTFQDLNLKLMEVGLFPVDRDARQGYASLRKLIEAKYPNQDFFQKWGATITIGMLVIAIIANGVVTYYNFSQQQKILATVNTGVQTSQKVAETSERIINKIESVNGGSGSGFVPADG